MSNLQNFFSNIVIYSQIIGHTGALILSNKNFPNNDERIKILLEDIKNMKEGLDLIEQQLQNK